MNYKRVYGMFKDYECEVFNYNSVISVADGGEADQNYCYLISNVCLRLRLSKFNVCEK